MNVKDRISIERRLVRHLIRVAKLAGWVIPYIDDGCEKVKTFSEREAMETVFSVDSCHIFFEKGPNRHCVYIVLGNDGFDAIADYSFSEKDEDGFYALMGQVNKYADYLCDENE